MEPPISFLPPLELMGPLQGYLVNLSKSTTAITVAMAVVTANSRAKLSLPLWTPPLQMARGVVYCARQEAVAMGGSGRNSNLQVVYCPAMHAQGEW